MAIISKEVQIGQKPTAEQIRRLDKLDDRDIVYDEESPELTDAELMEFRPAHPELYKPRKVMISIKIDADVLAAFKSGGRGYQTRINNVLRRAVEHGEIV